MIPNPDMRAQDPACWRLIVPVERAYRDPTPRVEGWWPWWVNVNLTRSPQKFTTYRRLIGGRRSMDTAAQWRRARERQAKRDKLAGR